MFETVIIRHLFESERYMRTVLPHLKPRYFDENHRAVFLAIAKYVAEFQKPPTSTIIRCEFANSNDNWSLSTTQGKLLEEIFSEGVELIQDIDWLISHTEKWCQDRAVYMALIESVDIIESGRNETSRIPELLRKALSVEFNPSVGHEYRSRSADRWNECHNESDRSRIFEFDIDQLNEITNGGVSPKTLNIVMSGPGGGKSLFMTHCAAHHFRQGRKVLYVTLEMSEYRIGQRIDANLLDMPINEIRKLSQDDYMRRMDELFERHPNGNITIREFPTALATADDVRLLIDELKIKRSFVPDILFVDYLNIMNSARIASHSANASSYQIVKSIAEELRGLAVERNVPVITGSQFNREGYNNSDPNMTNTAESAGINATADLILAIIAPTAPETSDVVTLKQLKNRYNDPYLNNRFQVSIDRTRMKLGNYEEVEFVPLA